MLLFECMESNSWRELVWLSFSHVYFFPSTIYIQLCLLYRCPECPQTQCHKGPLPSERWISYIHYLIGTEHYLIDNLILLFTFVCTYSWSFQFSLISLISTSVWSPFSSPPSLFAVALSLELLLLVSSSRLMLLSNSSIISFPSAEVLVTLLPWIFLKLVDDPPWDPAELFDSGLPQISRGLVKRLYHPLKSRHEVPKMKKTINPWDASLNTTMNHRGKLMCCASSHTSSVTPVVPNLREIRLMETRINTPHTTHTHTERERERERERREEIFYLPRPSSSRKRHQR